MADFDNIVPFTGENLPKPEAPAVLAEAAVQREIAEVQAAMTIAKRFPRNQAQALDRIMIACQRPTLAESALYSYARGGTEITGPSIRLAEAIVQLWGNVDFGIRELEQRNGESTVEAYAWDLETNTRQKKTFQVRHKRFTKKGSYDLSDPRDIYELVANQGARRLRACILGIIPGDIVEAAQNQCEQTLKAKADLSPKKVSKMITAFEGFQVSKSMIEARIQRKLESVTAAQVVALGKIYNSLKDGMSKPEDWFEVVAVESPKKEAKKDSKKPAPEASESPTSDDLPKTDTQARGDMERMITDAQIDAIDGLISTKHLRILDYIDKDMTKLTATEAAELIETLAAL